MSAVVRAGLLGHPVSHSRSPQIMSILSAHSGFELSYDLWDVAPDGVSEFLETLKGDSNWIGANVTVPHKLSVLEHVSRCSADVLRIGAANTLVQTDQGIEAHNTDKVGFQRALEFFECSVRDRTVLLLGAGGAARAVVCALLDCGVSKVHILNRSVDRAKSLVALDASRVVIRRSSEPCEVIVNATSLGLHQGDLARIKTLLSTFSSEGSAQHLEHAVDLVYPKMNEHTAFGAWCVEQKVPKIMHGLPMLIAQAMSSFELWSNKPFSIEIFHKVVSELGA